VFSGHFIAEEVDAVRDKGSRATRTIYVLAFLETLLPISVMKLFSCTKLHFPLWDYQPQVPDYIRVSDLIDKGLKELCCT
jgi:hypothetical protein